MTSQSEYSTPTPYSAEASVASRKAALRRGEYHIAVYGLGKIGLPVAVAFAELTGTVVGVDTDPDVVDTVDAGRVPFSHEPELDDLLSMFREEERLTVTSNGARAAEDASIHIIVVPVPLTDTFEADLSAIDAVLETIASGIAPGDLVVIETTVPPGTAETIIRPRLAALSDLDPAQFGVASCPERTSSGRALQDIRGSYPRVIGGVDTHSSESAFAIYDELVDNTVIVLDARTVEYVKLFEGVYRDVNIALANELAKAFDGRGVDVRDAIDAANTQPYCDIHRPGAGVGGHCIPWYPYMLQQDTPVEMDLLHTARSINDSMPTYLADRTISELRARDISPDSATVAVLGLAYRPGIPETAASPTFQLVGSLQQRVGHVAIVDPIIPPEIASLPLTPLEELPTMNPDAIVLMTGHSEFRDLSESYFEGSIVIDGRDALENVANRTYVVGRDP